MPHICERQSAFLDSNQDFVRHQYTRTDQTLKKSEVIGTFNCFTPYNQFRSWRKTVLKQHFLFKWREAHINMHCYLKRQENCIFSASSSNRTTSSDYSKSICESSDKRLTPEKSGDRFFSKKCLWRSQIKTEKADKPNKNCLELRI